MGRASDTNELVTGEERERARRGRRRARSWVDVEEPLQQIDRVSIPGQTLAGHASQNGTQVPDHLPLALRDLPALAVRHGERAAQPASRLAAEMGPARRIADARVEGKPNRKAAREFQKHGADRVDVDGRRRRRPQSLWMCNALRRAVLGRRRAALRGRRSVSLTA